jgi:hypothetical protein
LTVVGVGSPQYLILNAWGALVVDAFGAQPFLVGSATRTKQWRDVDVRVMLDQGEWARILPDVPGDRIGGFVYPQWSALCMAVSAWGQAFTGLPIDFQFQPVEWANAVHSGIREPLGVRITHTARAADALDSCSDKVLTKRGAARKRRPSAGTRELARVADLYRAALAAGGESGRKPAKYVHERLVTDGVDATPVQVRKWIARARRDGVLPSTTERKPGIGDQP